MNYMSNVELEAVRYSEMIIENNFQEAYSTNMLEFSVGTANFKRNLLFFLMKMQ